VSYWEMHGGGIVEGIGPPLWGTCLIEPASLARADIRLMDKPFYSQMPFFSVMYYFTTNDIHAEPLS